MIWWIAIAVGALLSFAIKLTGHLVPESLLAHPLVKRTADLLTIALLAALVAKQAFTADRAVMIDARAAALVVAGVLLWRRVPFLVVIIAAALTAAGLRVLGWG